MYENFFLSTISRLTEYAISKTENTNLIDKIKKLKVIIQEKESIDYLISSLAYFNCDDNTITLFNDACSILGMAEYEKIISHEFAHHLQYIFKPDDKISHSKTFENACKFIGIEPFSYYELSMYQYYLLDKSRGVKRAKSYHLLDCCSNTLFEYKNKIKSMRNNPCPICGDTFKATLLEL